MGESLPGPMAASLAACDRIASLDGDIQAFVAEPDRGARLAAEVAEMTAAWAGRAEFPVLYGLFAAVVIS